MKLLGVSLFASSALAQAPFQIPTSIESNLDEFFAAANAAGVFGQVDFTQIMNHGCHCKRLSDYSSGGGQAIDDLDQACKVFFDKRNCLKRGGPSGACNGINYSGDSYTAQLVFKNGADPSGGVMFGADPKFHCALETNPCKKSICSVDHQAIFSLITLEQGHPDHTFADDAQCVHQPGVVSEKICVGQIPNIKKVDPATAVPTKTATIKMNKNGDWLDESGCTGTITMKQFENPKRNELSWDLKNCGGAGAHGFHVHKFKDFSNGCLSTGGHFNPTGTATLADEVGMLQSIVVDEDGNAKGSTTDERAFLDGEYSIDNLPLTIHALDGSRMACGFVKIDETFERPCKTATVQMNSFGDAANQGCSGFIYVAQYKMDRTEFTYDLKNCGPAGTHGFHVHISADFSNACVSTGGHYNPTGETDTSLEVGMLPSLTSDANGNVRGTVTSTKAFLNGDYAIAGRSLVMHALNGDRYTCGEIVSDGVPTQEAVVTMMPKGDYNKDGCEGCVYLRQHGDSMQISYMFKNCGSNEEGSHGFHVHTSADFSDGCDSTGGHFNPTGETDVSLEVGMLSNVILGADGSGKGTFHDNRAFLDGQYSIDDLSLVMHSVSGPRITCGSVEAQQPFKTAITRMNAAGNWLDEANCHGTIKMEQFKNPMRNRITYAMENCPGEGLHGFHVHEVKDFSNGCTSTNGHYNPTGTTVLADEVGMLSSIPIDANGNANGVFEDTNALLTGEFPIGNFPLTMHALDGSRQACGFVQVQEKMEMPVLSATIKMNSYGDANRSGCSGYIFMKQFENPKRTQIDWDLWNCGGEGFHGFHVHEQADFSNECVSTGGHYNPEGVTDTSLEVGMLTSIYVDSNGKARGSQDDNRAFLDGDWAVAGRSLVMHALNGDRYTCGAITLDAAPEYVAQVDMMAGGDFNADGCGGTITLIQYADHTEFCYNLENCGASEAGYHGFHVHTAADFFAGCDSTGGHYNPTNESDTSLEVGMLEKIKINDDGSGKGSFIDSRAFLDGQHSIDGLSLVMHRLSGPRMSCGEIKIISSRRRR